MFFQIAGYSIMSENISGRFIYDFFTRHKNHGDKHDRKGMKNPISVALRFPKAASHHKNILKHFNAKLHN